MADINGEITQSNIIGSISQTNIIGSVLNNNSIDVDLFVQYKDTALIRYCSPNGSDTTGEGTLSNPYREPLKACQDLTKYKTTEQKTIILADGEYSNYVMPNELMGSLLIQGNATTPSSVTFTGYNTTSDIGIDINPECQCVITIDGVSFSTFWKAINNVGGNIEVGYCKFYNVKYGVYTERGYSLLGSGYSGYPTFDSNNVAVSYGLYAIRNSLVEINVPYTVTNCYCGLWAIQFSKFRFGSGANISITGGTQSNKQLMVFRESSLLSCAANISVTLDGNVSNPASILMDIETSQCNFGAGTTFDLKNSNQSIALFYQSQWYEAGICTHSFTNVTHQVEINELSYGYSQTNFSSATIEYFDGWGSHPEDTPRGTDNRYGKRNSGTAAPTITPLRIGDFYTDSLNKKLYVATGTTSSADWTILN